MNLGSILSVDLFLQVLPTSGPPQDATKGGSCCFLVIVHMCPCPHVCVRTLNVKGRSPSSHMRVRTHAHDHEQQQEHN